MKSGDTFLRPAVRLVTSVSMSASDIVNTSARRFMIATAIGSARISNDSRRAVGICANAFFAASKNSARVGLHSSRAHKISSRVVGSTPSSTHTRPRSVSIASPRTLSASASNARKRAESPFFMRSSQQRARKFACVVGLASRIVRMSVAPI